MEQARLRQIDRLARSQHSLVTTRQLSDMGVSRGQVIQLLRAGRFVSLRRGVYVMAGVAPSWPRSVLAAVLAVSHPAYASHRTAAAIWGLLDYHDGPGPIELITCGQCELDGVVGHRQRVAPKDVTTRQRIPVTTPERTLLDLAAYFTVTDLGRLCDEALRRRLITLARLQATVERHAGRGRRRLHPIQAVLADRVPGYDPGANDWERRMDRMWDRLGLPPAERQFRVRLGGRTFILDRAIPDLRIAVEWNGYETHGTRTGFDRDSDRRAYLAAAGWYPLDFTSRTDPALICRTVEAVVAERTRRAG